MFRAIAIKELRETWWIGALAGFILLLGVLGDWGLQLGDLFSLRWSPDDDLAAGVPFQGEDWPVWVLIAGMIGGAVLGLRQTLGESAQGTWGFYLYRPADRDFLVMTKAVVGLVGLMVALAVPLLLFTAWAAAPGTHASPFAWWMAGPTLQAWGFASVGYLTGFLCGLRPARWWASRFVPGAAVGFLWITVLVQPWAAGANWLMVLIADALLAAAIVEVARTRDWG